MNMGKCKAIGALIGLIFWGISFPAHGQNPQHAFRIHFTDKQGSPPLTQAADFLSPRSLDRRQNLQIALDSTDQPLSPVYVEEVMQISQGVYHLGSKWLNYLVLLIEDTSTLAGIRALPFVRQLDYVGYYPTGLHAKTSGNPKTDSERPLSLVARTTGSPEFYGAAYPQTQLVRGDFLHDRQFMGQGKLIAILDAGFRYADTNPAFDSLRHGGRLLDVHNFVLANDDVYGYDAHGTAALSTMAAYLPGTYVGSAPLADYALYVTEEGGKEQPIEMDNLVAAAERADSLGADVISVSLGYNEFFTPQAYTLPFSDLDGNTTVAARSANLASEKGILYVASAGNEGGNSWNRILTPGDASLALTVGNVDLNYMPAPTSGRGPNAAGQVKPDVCVAGSPATILTGNSQAQNSYGTSFATSQLAGWAACLMQATSIPRPFRIRTAIRESAHTFSNPNPNLGFGVPDFGLAYALLDLQDPPGTPGVENRITVYPNPFGSSFSLQVYLDRSGPIQLQLYTVQGQIMESLERRGLAGIERFHFSTAHYPAGMYYIKVICSGQQKVFPVVKN